MKKIITIATAAVVTASIAAVIAGFSVSANQNEDTKEEPGYGSYMPHVSEEGTVLPGRYYVDGDTTKPYIQMSQDSFRLICDDYDAFEAEILSNYTNADDLTENDLYAEKLGVLWGVREDVNYVPQEFGYEGMDIHKYILCTNYLYDKDECGNIGYGYTPGERPSVYVFDHNFEYVPESEWAESAE